MNIKKGDNVIVITGKDKGKKGKVLQVFRDAGKVVVEGVNLRKKHRKPRKTGEKGQVIDIPSPLHASNVMIADPKSGKPSRIGHKMIKDKKIRIAQRSGVEI